MSVRPSAVGGGSPASSVDSADLNELLHELNIPGAPPVQQRQQRPKSAAKRRFVLDSESDADSLPSSDRSQASPRLERASSKVAAAAAAPPPAPPAAATPPVQRRQQQQQQQQQQFIEPEVIEILDSSSESEADSDNGGWRSAAPATGQRQRRVIADSDSSSDCEEVVSGAARGNSSALPAFFATIPSLAAAQQQPQQQQRPAAAAPPRQQPAAQPPRQSTQQTAAGPAAPARAAAAAAAAAPATARPLSSTAFKKQREEMTCQLFKEFNRTVFEGRLPADMEIKWNARLLTTAGLTHYRRDIPDDPYAPPIYSARVELSCKVLDSFSKLERTLCHELCHVAAWLVDHTAKPPHGPVFRRWADLAMGRYTHLDITTCHAYEIFFPFRWQCSNAACLQSYGRHSNSIDVAKKVCGACRAPLTFLGRFKPDGTPAKQRAAPSVYAQFVKDNHAAVRSDLPAGTPQSVVMQKLSERYAAQKEASLQSGAGAGTSSSLGGGASDSGTGSVVSRADGAADDGATSPLAGLLLRTRA